MQEAAVRAERWAWVTITRKEGELRTYMNGRLCAEIKLQTKEEEAKKKKLAEEARRKQQEGSAEADGVAKEVKKVPVERFCIDAKMLALFANPEAAEGDAEVAAERGLCVQFVKLESKVALHPSLLQ